MTHAELLTLAGERSLPGCPHQLAKLGTWVEPGCPCKPAFPVSVFHCRHCGVVIEINHRPSEGFPRMEFRESYPYATALWPARRRPPF